MDKKFWNKLFRENKLNVINESIKTASELENAIKNTKGISRALNVVVEVGNNVYTIKSIKESNGLFIIKCEK